MDETRQPLSLNITSCRLIRRQKSDTRLAYLKVARGMVVTHKVNTEMLTPYFTSECPHSVRVRLTRV